MLGRDPWTAREQLMRDVSFIADVAVLPRWIRVSQLLDYVAGVHPRFDRAKAEGFLARTTIKRASKVRQLSKGMVAQLHLALVMAIDAKLLVLDEPTLGLDILYRKQFYDSLLNDYFDRQPHHRGDDASGGRDPGRPDRSHVHQSRPHRARMQHGRIRVALCGSDGESRTMSPAARSLKPMHERQVFGRSVMLFENVDRDQLAALGEVRTPSIADLFVAVMEPAVAQGYGRADRSEEGSQVNSPNRIPLPDLPNDSGARPELQRCPATRPFYWSVWRELWENRSIYIAPLIVAAVQVFGFAISTIGLAERRRAVLLLDPAKQRAAIEQPYDMAAMMMIFTVFIVGVFYCLDALHGERRDRSILFWKSLPVSDLTTVLSKAIIPLVVLPADRLRARRLRAADHAADDQRSPRIARNESGDDVGPLPGVSELARAALRPDRDCALARADLRLAAAGFRLGAARDISLGGVAANRDPNLREDYVRHFVFRGRCCNTA